MSRAVLVSGGSRGIGLACARWFADRGDRVAVLARGDAPADVHVEKCDVRSTDDVDRAVSRVEDRIGPIEVLVANAGITADDLVVRMTDDEFDEVLDTNLFGAFRLARRVTRAMMRARSGRMVFVSSVAAFVGTPGQANYAASKAGLVGLARSVARELAPRHVTVNVVAPGLIATDMTARLTAAQSQALLAMTPLGRHGTPDEVAAAVGFLASERAAFITGAILAVDGGAGMGL